MAQPKKEKKKTPKKRDANAPKRTSQGRQKTNLRRIENDSNRQVTLSKRRKGLFSKGAELCILTGAELAIFARAENGKFTTFGHPDTDDVIDRYLNTPNSEAAPSQINAELLNEHGRLSSELEAEKKAQKKGNVVNEFWWNEPMDNLGIEELQQCIDSLVKLRDNVLAADNDQYQYQHQHQHQYDSQRMGVVSDNVGMEAADLDNSMLANELLNDSQGVLNNDFTQNDVCSSQYYQSFFSMDSYGADFCYL